MKLQISPLRYASVEMTNLLEEQAGSVPLSPAG